MYVVVKYVHLATAIISIAGFVLRGVWMLGESRWLQAKPVKILPHIVDTLFLASGIVLAVLLGQYPFVHAWLTAKVIGLIAYIVLGTVALKRGRTKTLRTIVWLVSILLFVWIASVARSRSAWGFLSALM